MYHPWGVPHEQLREMAFKMQAEELRQYATDLLVRKPDRMAAAEVLNLMSYLVACEYVTAEAHVATIEFKYKGTTDERYINHAVALAKAHIYFAFGKFSSMETAANKFLESYNEVPDIEAGEYLDIMRLKAQKHLILDEFVDLRKIDEEVQQYKSDSNSPNILYLINSIHSMRLLADGEFIKAMELAQINLRIAENHNYSGLMAPIETLFVIATCYMALGKRDKCNEKYLELKKLSISLRMWPWYFIASGNISRDLAHKSDYKSALAIVREERELLSTFEFKHELDFIPDVNELYVRFLIGDSERMNILFKRIPKLAIVEQIKAVLREQNGEDMISYINSLPNISPRERTFKYVALADYYKDKESIAVDYMEQALISGEQSGATEIFLRQFHLANITLKAAIRIKSVYAENLQALLTERIRQKEFQNREGVIGTLTIRELEIVRHLTTGKSIKEIGSNLHVSMNTMKTHLRNIYRKLEVDGREKAVEKAKDLMLI